VQLYRSNSLANKPSASLTRPVLLRVGQLTSTNNLANRLAIEALRLDAKYQPAADNLADTLKTKAPQERSLPIAPPPRLKQPAP
jgi:hypothetical protein